MSQGFAVRVPLLVLWVLSAAAHWLLPRLTRPDLYFAVTVAAGFRDSTAGRGILRRYRRGLIIASILTAAPLAALALTPALPLAPLALILQLGAYFSVFYRARRLVLPHSLAPTTVREAQVGGRDRRIPGGWAAASGPFALLAACAGYLYMHWQQIPARLVTHWSAQGRPDRWVTRGLDTVFLPLVVGAVVLVALTLLLSGMAHWVRPIYAGGSRGEHESRFRRAASIMLLVVEYWIALLLSWLMIRPLLPAWIQRPPAAIAMVPGLIAVVVTAVLMRLGQGGSGMPSAEEPDSVATRPVGDRTEDRFWKLGVLYFNRNDPSVMVEKRFGLGYTMNFARPVAWAIVLIPVLALFAITTTIAVRHTH